MGSNNTDVGRERVGGYTPRGMGEVVLCSDSGRRTIGLEAMLCESIHARKEERMKVVTCS